MTVHLLAMSIQHYQTFKARGAWKGELYELRLIAQAIGVCVYGKGHGHVERIDELLDSDVTTVWSDLPQ